MIKSITVRTLEDNTSKFVLRAFDLAFLTSVALGYGNKKVSLHRTVNSTDLLYLHLQV